MSNAQAFCEALVPRLEQVRSETGSYPRDVSEALGGQRPPGPLGSRFYWSDGTSFSFTIGDPGTIMGGVEYTSQSGGWYRWD